MSDRIEINKANVTLFRANDGSGFRALEASGDKGYRYTLEIDPAASERQVGDLLRNVREVGSIDPTLWYTYAPYGTVAYQEEGIEEQTAYAERYEGLGEGTELAHVW